MQDTCFLQKNVVPPCWSVDRDSQMSDCFQLQQKSLNSESSSAFAPVELPRQMALSSSFIASQSHLIDSLFMTSELQKQQVLYSKPREVHSIVFPSDKLRQKAINQDHHQSINPKKRRHSTRIRVHYIPLLIYSAWYWLARPTIYYFCRK